MTKKIVLRAFVIYILEFALIFSLFIYKIKADDLWLVGVKYSLFTEFISDRSLFTATPEQLTALNFKGDSPELIKSWASLISAKVDYLRNFNKDMFPKSEIEKAKSIVLLFSKNGEGCAPDISLLEKIKKLPMGNGYGCCSDHTKVFIALSSVFGLTAREVHTVGHVQNEFFSYTLNKWVWIDPLYAVLAKNSTGAYLSLLEIRDLYYKNKPVNFVFFGNEFHFLMNHRPDEISYFDDKEKFSTAMITWGNNVFTVDKFNQYIKVLPKFVRQFIAINLGIAPSYVSYIDAHNTADVRAPIIRKKIENGILIVFIIGALLFPIHYSLLYEYEPY